MRNKMQPVQIQVKTMTNLKNVMNAFRRERIRARIGEEERALNEVVFSNGPRSLAGAIAGWRPDAQTARRRQHIALIMPAAALRLAA